MDEYNAEFLLVVAYSDSPRVAMQVFKLREYKLHDFLGHIEKLKQNDVKG